MYSQNDIFPSSGQDRQRISTDVLLRWMSEVSRGRINWLWDKFRWYVMSQSAEVEVERKHFNVWLSTLQILGYVNLHWRDGDWEVCQPKIYFLPRSDGGFVMTGARSAELCRLIQSEHYFKVREMSQESAFPWLNLPAKLIGVCSNFGYLREFAEDNRIELCLHEATIKAKSLDFLIPLERRLERNSERNDLRPSGNAHVRKIEPYKSKLVDDDRTTVKLASREADASFWNNGLYSVSANGLTRHVLVRDGWQAEVERGIGVFSELRKQGWNPFETKPYDTRRRLLNVIVDMYLTLPIEAERCLASCSGGIKYHHDTESSRKTFINVPVEIYEMVVASLGVYQNEIEDD